MKIERKIHFCGGSILLIMLLLTFGCNFSYSVGIPKEPTNEDLQTLAKKTMTDFTEALEKDDFDGLRSKTSKSFQQQYTAEQIKNSFGVFITKKDLSVPLFRATQTIDAEFSTQPQMSEADKLYFLEMKGKFSTQPRNLNFHFEYIREEGKWKLTKFQVKT